MAMSSPVQTSSLHLTCVGLHRRITQRPDHGGTCRGSSLEEAGEGVAALMRCIANV